MKYIFTLFILISLFTFRSNKWDKYYANKLEQPPREIVVEASKEYVGTALDLGCGVGNETVYLLSKGWKVWAIDNQPKALEILLSRKDVELKALTTLNVSFDAIDWKGLPQFDLVVASFSLPFCLPKHFEGIWKNITAHINSGGRFAGHFFGPNYTELGSEVTLLTKEKVLALFAGFKIESFQETEEDGISGGGVQCHSHIFHVIARKI